MTPFKQKLLERQASHKDVRLTPDQIVVDRQALLDIVAALDLGLGSHERRQNIPHALDKLREPFFPDEFSSGQARRDFSMNTYGGS